MIVVRKEKKTSATAVDKLLAKSNPVSVNEYESGSDASHQMYTFEHPETAQTGALTDYRYIGNDPYNYVEFNGETWRIIGVFTVEDGNGNTSPRIKIIKDELLSENREWDSNYVNDWKTSTLNIYLNGDYYTGLSSVAKEMISPAKTYLGGAKYLEWENVGTAEDMYFWERGIDRPKGGTRSLNDIKNVSLIYPSDYTYTYGKGIDNVCYSDGHSCYSGWGGNPSLGWLYKSPYQWWTVSPIAAHYGYVFFILIGGNVFSDDVRQMEGVRPVVYLKPEVKIVSGDGTKDNPYKFKI